MDIKLRGVNSSSSKPPASIIRPSIHGGILPVPSSNVNASSSSSSSLSSLSSSLSISFEEDSAYGSSLLLKLASEAVSELLISSVLLESVSESNSDPLSTSLMVRSPFFALAKSALLRSWSGMYCRRPSMERTM